MPNLSTYRPDYPFQTVTGAWEVGPSKSRYSKDLQDRLLIMALGNHTQAGLSLLEDIDSSTRGFCAILSRDLVAQERSLSFTYGRPVESWSSLVQMYFGKYLNVPRLRFRLGFRLTFGFRLRFTN